MSNNQLPADVQERIKADAIKAVKVKDWGESLQIESYIAGATAEADSIQPVIDAAEKVAKLFAHKGDNQTCAICQLANALQQWKEGKEPQVELSCMVCGTKFMGPEPKMCCSGRDCGCMGLPIDPIVCSEECYNNLPAKKQTQGKEVGQAEAKEGLVRLILAGAAEVSKDGESAKQYLAKEGVDVKKVMEDGRYIQWKEGKEVGNG